MKILKTLAVAAVIFSVGNFGSTAAEREGRKGGFGDRRSGGSGRSSMMQNMDPKVMEAMREAFRDAGGSVRELAGKEQKLRRELAEMMTSGEVDEKALRDKVMAIAEVQVETTIMRAKMFAKMKEAGASSEMLKMMAARMSGGAMAQRGGGFQGGDEGMRRGDKAGFSREGFGGGDRRPSRGKPDEAESKKRRPEFE